MDVDGSHMPTPLECRERIGGDRIYLTGSSFSLTPHEDDKPLGSLVWRVAGPQEHALDTPVPHSAGIPCYLEYVLHNALADTDQVVAVRVEGIAQGARFALCIPHN